MNKIILTIITLLLLTTEVWAREQIRVTILATGGTIAGAAGKATQASYTPGVISVDDIIASVPDIENIATLTGIQVCNISSQNMTSKIWFRLHTIIDSLFTNNLADGIVITHGTDTMEETAYFLNLTVNHSKPVVLTGSMRPSTSLSADGPFNLYNAVALAASKEASGKGVMVVMNDYILSADDVVKSHTVNTQAFNCPNYGPLGHIRDGIPSFYRESRNIHTYKSDFNLKTINELPNVEIVFSYSFASAAGLKAIIDLGVNGIVIAGVGHGNYNNEYAAELDRGYDAGIRFVRSSRILTGGVDKAAEDYDPKQIVSGAKSPQKSRILLMLALTKTDDSRQIQHYFDNY